jgi:hypothetical protein
MSVPSFAHKLFHSKQFSRRHMTGSRQAQQFPLADQFGFVDSDKNEYRRCYPDGGGDQYND